MVGQSGIIKAIEKSRKQTQGDDMEAIREIRVLKDNTLTIVLPESFAKAQVEILVLRIATDDTNRMPVTKQRTPSPLLTGTRIIGDIMSSVVPDTDWEALS